MQDIKLFQTVFQSSPGGILIVNGDGVIVKVNKTIEKLFGYNTGELNNKDTTVIIPVKFKNFFNNNTKEKLNKYEIRYNIPIWGINKEGHKFPLELSLASIEYEDKPMTIFFVRDITSYYNSELLKKEFREVLLMINQHIPINLIGYQLNGIIEEYIPESISAILLLDENTNNLHRLAAPNLPEIFCKQIEEFSINAKTCCCALAALEKNDIIIEDIESASIDKVYKEQALNHNFKTNWSSPIMSSSQKVLGVLSIYFKHRHKPSNIEKELIKDVNQLLAAAIEKENATVALKNNKTKLEFYTKNLEEMVEQRTNELKNTITSLVTSNLKLEDQIQITNQAEARMRASQEMLSAIVKNFPKGIIVVFNLNFKIDYIEGEELNDIELKDKIYAGINYDDIDVFSNENKNELKVNIYYTLKGKHLSFEAKYKDNTYSVNTTPLFNESKEIVQALLVFTNISNQKKTQLEMLDNLRKEKELNELKSRFISMASHEFRTPLSVILSSTILIEKQNSAGNGDKRKKHIDKIRSNVNNLKMILDDFLSLSKLEEGKIESKPINFDIINFSKSLIDELRPSQKRGQIINVISNSNSIQVNMDPKLIRHVLTNLLSNAMKYSKENKDIVLLITRNKKSLLLEVKDKGIGIPKHEQKNVFQRFYRASNASNIQGTGLGLHIAKQYVELAGGIIGFNSKLSEGTTFSIELPLNRLKNEKSISN